MELFPVCSIISRVSTVVSMAVSKMSGVPEVSGVSIMSSVPEMMGRSRVGDGWWRCVGDGGRVSVTDGPDSRHQAVAVVHTGDDATVGQAGGNLSIRVSC